MRWTVVSPTVLPVIGVARSDSSSRGVHHFRPHTPICPGKARSDKLSVFGVIPSLALIELPNRFRMTRFIDDWG